MEKKLKVLSKRALAGFLSIMLCVSMLQLTAFAADEQIISAPVGGEPQVEPVVVEPDPVEPEPEKAAGSDAKEVDATLSFDENGNPKVEVTDRPTTEPGEKVEYTGDIIGEDGQPVKTPEGGNAQVTGSETNTKGETVTEPETDRVVSESNKVENEEKTDPMDVPVEQPEPPVPPVADETIDVKPADKVEVKVDPETGEGKGEFSATEEQLNKLRDEKLKELDKELVPDKDKNLEPKKDAEGKDIADTYEKVTPGENGGSTTETWQKVPTDEKDGYKVIETMTEVKVETGLKAPALEVPKSDPDNGITVEGNGDSYKVTTVTKVGDVEITKVETVTNGTMTVTTTTVTTKTTTYKVEAVADENGKGSVTVKVDGVKAENGELDTEGLKPMVGKGTPYIVSASALNVRPNAGDTSTTSAPSISKGSVVYVTKTKKVGNALWGEIGDGQWICLDTAASNAGKGAYAGEQYQVVTTSVTAYKDGPNKGNKKWPQLGETVFITDKSGNYGKVTGGKYDGYWIYLGPNNKYVDNVGSFDPEDDKVNVNTDLYGYKDKVTTKPTEGRPNDNYSTTGTLYKISDTQKLHGIGNNGELVPYGAIGNGGFIYVNEEKEIGGKKYGVIGKNKFGYDIVVPLDDLSEPSAEEGKFLFYGEYGLSSAVGVNLANGKDENGKDLHWYNVHQFLIKDEHGKDHYVYCADLSVNPKNDVEYNMANVADADFLEKNAAQVGAIAVNGYWGTESGTGSMEDFKKWLGDIGYKESLDWMTPGLAMTVTQAAIWHYGNSKQFAENQKPEGDKNAVMGVDNANPFRNAYNSIGITEGDLTKLAALYDYLTDSKNADAIGKTNKKATDLVNEEDVKDVAVSVKNVATADNTDTYDADISFRLDVEPGTFFKNMVVKVYDSNNNVCGSYELANTSGLRSNGDNTYTISVQVSKDTKLTLKISGTQDVSKAAYLITAKGGYETSQTFISVEEGKREFELNVDLNLQFQEAKATVTTTAKAETTKTEQIGSKWDRSESASYTYKKDPDNPTPVEPDDPPPPSDDDDPDDPPTPPTTTERRRTPPTPPTYVEIPDEPVPMASVPPVTPPADNLIEILDEDVPLAGLPSEPGTGAVSHRSLWATILIASLGGLLILLHKDEEEAA